MAPPQGSASYKKQNGILAISKDRKAVSWTPAQPSDASPTVVITAASVSNLQQTPESNPKVMLKIFVQDKGQAEPTTHVFTLHLPLPELKEMLSKMPSLPSFKLKRPPRMLPILLH